MKRCMDGWMCDILMGILTQIFIETVWMCGWMLQLPSVLVPVGMNTCMHTFMMRNFCHHTLAKTLSGHPGSSSRAFRAKDHFERPCRTKIAVGVGLLFGFVWFCGTHPPEKLDFAEERRYQISGWRPMLCSTRRLVGTGLMSCS